MRLNQVTLPASSLDASVAFYESLGFLLIVKNGHYARLENPSDHTTLSLELRHDAGAGNKLCLYFAGANRRFPPWRIPD